MQSYVDTLMQNNPFEYVHSSEEYNENIVLKQYGGKTDITNKATGSFPPIYLETKEELEKKESDKDRGFAKPNKTAVSIKEIMEKRRDDKKPFISL